MTLPDKLTGRLLAPARPAGATPACATPACDGRVLDAAMAAAALVVNATAARQETKRKALVPVLRSVSALQAFAAEPAFDSFEVFDRMIRRRGQDGRQRALTAISDIAGDGDGAQAVLRAGLAMAGGAGPRTAAQEEAIAAIAAAAGLAPPASARAPPASAGATTVSTEANEAGSAAGRIITIANAKGGTGKSTTAVHLIAGLLALGHRVGSLDLDGQQGTLSHFVSNRTALSAAGGRTLPCPQHRRIVHARRADRARAADWERAALARALAELAPCRYIVIDTPGSDCHLARLGCAAADILIMPVNDSLLDIDVLARIDPDRRQVLGPSDYSKLVWEENDRRSAQGRPPIDWIVMPNRLGSLASGNRREVEHLLHQLAQRIGFRLAGGLGERVLYRAQFYEGLTLFDQPADAQNGRVSRDQSRARAELDRLLRLVDAGPETLSRTG